MIPSLADACGTDVEFYRRPFSTTIHADVRADAPAELLGQLDALGLLRCGAQPFGWWHQVPDGLDEAAGRRLACDAATALTKAGWKVNIDPGLLAGRTSGATAGAVIAETSPLPAATGSAVLPGPLRVSGASRPPRPTGIPRCSRWTPRTCWTASPKA